MEKVNKAQLATIHKLLFLLKIVDADIKESLVMQFTNERERSSAHLHYQEAELLIAELKRRTRENNNFCKGDKSRKLIIHYAHLMGWETDGKADIKRINGWCTQFGYLHKGLNEYSAEELPRLVYQFEMVYKSFLMGI
ncbi:hypothetical protein GFS24_10330 [Chitinophaga sp. SYP-B3965]|uniref:hypothetical protein n=1 Tax=Chitinophaga sp. SYP-B3965 TaxID=2663120 RepID=UPI001299916E|nr:hypothetical protein [Chitinophaga sp. SYP-B3965]MRG45513.1 hypothetical protein [Chitinophaga sp. SYP-B3965]